MSDITRQLDDLIEQAATDPTHGYAGAVAEAAKDEIERLRAALKPFAEFRRVHLGQSHTPITGEVYKVVSKSGNATLYAEDFDRAIELSSPLAADEDGGENG